MCWDDTRVKTRYPHLLLERAHDLCGPGARTNRSAGSESHLHNGDRGKHGYAIRGYVAYGHTYSSPIQVARLYRRRAIVEKSYQLSRTARGNTSTPDPVVRLLYVAVRFVLDAKVQWEEFDKERERKFYWKTCLLLSSGSFRVQRA